MSQFVSAYINGDEATAKEIDARLQPIHQILFVESSPQPTKWALASDGQDRYRHPIAAAADVGGESPRTRTTVARGRSHRVIRRRFRAALTICLMLLAGCGWMSDDKGFFVDRSNDYLKAKEGPPLIVPEDLSSTSIENTMAIPQISSTQRHVNFEGGAPRPEAIYAREEAEGVKIQKLGDQRWLLVPQAPAVVWPKVKQFFADNGVAIELEQPQTGRIDTEWMTISSKAARDVVRLSISDARQSAGVTTGRDRVRVLIEPGIRDRSTEIHLRYENDSKSMPHEDVMPAQSDIVEVETQLLNELGGYIAANVAGREHLVRRTQHQHAEQGGIAARRVGPADAAAQSRFRSRVGHGQPGSARSESRRHRRGPLRRCVLRDRHRPDVEPGRKTVDLDALVPQRAQA
jgi:uncharacterized lipoprotein